MYYFLLVVSPTVSRIIKYFDYFAERHPYSALSLPYCGMVPAYIILHSVSLLQFIPEGVRFLLIFVIYGTNLISLFFVFRATRFLPAIQIPFFSSQARTSFPDFGSYNPEHDPEISLVGRFVVRHPDFTLFWLLLCVLPLHQIPYQMILSAGLDTNPVIMCIFALISIAVTSISVVLFFKAFRLIVHAEGGMGGMSGKAYR